MSWESVCWGASLSLDKKTILNTSQYGGARSKTSYTTGKRYWEVTFGSGAMTYGMFGFNQGSEWIQNQFVWGQPGMELVYAYGNSLSYAKTLKHYSGSYGSYTSGTYGFAIDIPGQYFYMYFPNGSVTTFTFTFKNEPIYIMDGAGSGEIYNVVLNTTGPFQKTIPDGFTSWDLQPYKYLYYFNNKTYKVNNNILVEVSNNLPTENDFKDNGMNAINSSDVSLINGPYILYTYDYSNEPSNKIINITPNQKEKIIKSFENISFTDSDSIDNITINSTNVKMLFSNDDGKIYYSYENERWNEYELNIDNMKLHGMTYDIINSIPSLKLNEFILKPNSIKQLKISFILLDNTSSVNSTISQSDLNGSWNRYDAINSNYSMTYITNNIIKINLMTEGRYKINY